MERLICVPLNQVKRTITVLKEEINFRGPVDIVSGGHILFILMLLVDHLIELARAVAFYIVVVFIDAGFRRKVGKIGIIAQVGNGKVKYRCQMRTD